MAWHFTCQATPWIVMYGHKPLYCSTNDYYDCEVGAPMRIRPAVEPLMKVDT
jgi:hypothetical protein